MSLTRAGSGQWRFGCPRGRCCHDLATLVDDLDDLTGPDVLDQLVAQPTDPFCMQLGRDLTGSGPAGVLYAADQGLLQQQEEHCGTRSQGDAHDQDGRHG